MKVKLLKECGYKEAVLGFSLSYNTSLERTEAILARYAWGVPGESKYLESIQLWIDVVAPRFWWQEADTYRVGTSKQSESTMHTICKAPLTQDNFEFQVADETIDRLNFFIKRYKSATEPDERLDCFLRIKNELPEGFLQRRIWNMNYKVLQGIVLQRYKHRLPQWRVFCDTLLSSVEHPEFIRKEPNENSV